MTGRTPAPAANALEAFVRRARAGEVMLEADFFDLARALERELGDAIDVPHGGALRALLAPGFRDGSFYLADAFAPALRPARDALLREDDDLAARRAAIGARVRALCGVDVTGDEAIVLRRRYDGPLPDGAVVTRETFAWRFVVIRAGTTERDRAFATLARVEAEARRTLADAIARVAQDGC